MTVINNAVAKNIATVAITITKEFSKEHATPENVGAIMTQKVKETA